MKGNVMTKQLGEKTHAGFPQVSYFILKKLSRSQAFYIKGCGPINFKILPKACGNRFNMLILMQMAQECMMG